MPEPLPEFESPPVIETALSIQFERLQSYSTALAGWFWHSHLSNVSGTRGNWAQAKLLDAPRIPDVFERFGADEIWRQPGVLFAAGGESQRTQITSPDEQYMLQIQDSRLILNWRKRHSEYPRFSSLNPDFWTAFRTFEEFAIAAKIGPIEQNQWEVTYVNHIPKGDMWESPSDWHRILPSILFPPAAGGEPVAEAMSGDWRFGLGNQRGRLYVGLRHAKTGPQGDELLVLTFTARGPVDSAAGSSARSGFDLGHETIVRSFAAITSPEAHKRWKRRR